MRQSTFDTMLRLRVNVPTPDPDIVIVDIDEKTLAAMSADYGRWPWPRQVLAEFLQNVEAQQPKAVVFDVLFSDPDIQNPDSDAYFNEVVAGTSNSYFPMLRLPMSTMRCRNCRPPVYRGRSRVSGLSPMPVWP
jgi:adenylate cyclase